MRPRLPINIYFIALSLIGASFMNACSPEKQQNDDKAAVFDASKDYFETKAEVQYASNFDVSYHGHYKVVRTSASLSSWEGGATESREDVMVLVQKGTPTPELTGNLTGATVIPIPAERVAVNIENGEVYISELGLFDKVVAVGGAISYDDEIRNRVLNKELAQVGYSWHQPANLELLLASNADLFLMNLSNLDFAGTLNKSRELGIPTASVFEWAESNYLGKAEWIKFYSLFFNAEARANKRFGEMVQRVAELRNLAAEVDKKPTMVWGYYAGNDRWMVHTNSIEAQFMRDAGLDNLMEDFSQPVRNNGAPVSSEAFLSQAYKADHWVIGDVHSASLPTQNYLSQFESWKRGQLYHNMKRIKPKANAFDWYGSAAVRPDLVLADLIKLIYPAQLPSHELYFMDHFDKSMKLPLEVNEQLYGE